MDQRALAFHLVGQERSCGAFACAGKGVNPDESAGRLGWAVMTASWVLRNQ